MLPFLLAYSTLPLALIHPLLIAIPIAFLALALAAITYNDLFRKSKSPAQVFRTFPILIAYYHVRLVGYASESLRLLLTGTTSEGTRLPKIDLSAIKREATR